MRARYCDGRTALFRDSDCAFTPVGALIGVDGAQHIWRYQDLARTDDGNSRLILKFKTDTGERLMLERDAEAALRAVAPALCKPRAQGVERPRAVVGLVASAWALAGAFLVGVPLAAEPIAGIVPPRYRAQIADISWSQVNAFTDYCDDSDEAARILNDVAYSMMAASGVSRRDDIWISIVDAPIPNAFALSDDSIVVTDDLITLAEHPDEIIGVIAHEIAHIEQNHVMKNIVRGVGAGIFFDVVFGGAGAGQAIAIASVNLAGLRYSRGDEADADARGLGYLEAAHIDPDALARLFERLEQEGGEIPTLLSSHPATAARAAAARARAQAGRQPSLDDAQWRIVRSACGGSPASNRAPPAPAPSTAPAQPAKPEDLEGAAKPR